MSSKALFLDRDGTINYDPGYLGDPEKVKLIEGAGEALARLQQGYNYRLIVVSNQSGVARGMISTADVEAVNKRIASLLKADGAEIDRFYYCPHHPDYSSAEESICRKPSPAMILQAVQDYDIDVEQSFMIGDSDKDVLCGMNAGVKTVLVLTGNGREAFSVLHKQNKLPNFVAENLVDASKAIEKEFYGA